MSGEPRPPARRVDASEVAAELAARLGETDALPRRQLARALRTLGEARTRAFLAEALALEAAGGLTLPDGSRRRTPGGVFFHLVRRAATPAERRAIFPRAGRGGAAAAAGPALDWADCPAAVAELQRGMGGRRV